jgi:S1-C subfamily serine protease
MNKTVLTVVTALTLLASPALAWDQTKMNSQVDATNFLLNSGCSATLIASDELLTAAHCIEGQYTIVTQQKVDKDGKVTEEKVRVASPGTVSQIFYQGPNETHRVEYTFKTKKSDDKLDLAVVKLMSPITNPVAKVACQAPKRGDWVAAVGNSLGILYATVSYGNVSNVHRSYLSLGIEGHDDLGLTQTTAPIGGGNSGGALYNSDGEIVGVNVRGYQQIAPVAFAVELGDIRKFLELKNCDAN